MTHVPWHEVKDQDDLESVRGIESVKFLSVGIDIGTTTTHLLVSELTAEQQGADHSSDFEVIDTEITYESPILLTPFEGGDIDAERIDAFIEECYAEAGLSPADIDTGAVIVTGEASRKRNAEAIAELFSEQAGKFVCATAGANLEAMMAAHGSGAVDYAVETETDVLHVDIGGGTTKLAYVVDGFIEETASINVGARLVRFDGETLTGVESAAERVASELDVDLEVGEPFGRTSRERLAERFAAVLFDFVQGEDTPLIEELLVTDDPDRYPFDTITFSGGASEYVYDRDPGYFGDLGPQLGSAIRAQLDSRELPVEEFDSGIRATVLGSNEQNTQVSGNTITITDEDHLPIRNVPMVPFVVDTDEDEQSLTARMNEKLARYDTAKASDSVALGFHLHGRPTAEFLRTIVRSSLAAIPSGSEENPLIMAFDSDIAMNAGRIADELTTRPTVAVDNIDLKQFGYVDVGTPLEETRAVPVSVKSLIFEG
jgi:ethanolamine utilization protein EutA